MNKQQFMEKLFDDRDFKVTNNQCFGKLANNNVVNIVLSDSGHVNRFNKLVVSIISPTVGLIDKTVFNFEDLVCDPNNNTHTGTNHEGLHATLFNDDFHWCIDYPTTESLDVMFDSIEYYISLFE